MIFAGYGDYIMSTKKKYNKHPNSKKVVINSAGKENNLVLSHQDAKAASPANMSVCGEEDPGVALEWAVTGDR